MSESNIFDLARSFSMAAVYASNLSQLLYNVQSTYSAQKCLANIAYMSIQLCTPAHICLHSLEHTLIMNAMLQDKLSLGKPAGAWDHM